MACHKPLLCTCVGYTSLIPKLRHSDVESNFSNEFFRHVITKLPLTEKLLHFIVMKLPDSQMSVSAYDASFLNLRTILCRSKEGAVIKRLLKCRMKVKEEDIIAATEGLADSQVNIYEMILSHSTLEEDSQQKMLKRACLKALKARKKSFVVSLIKQGATPSPELLKSEGMGGDPYVQTYLESVSPAMLHKTISPEMLARQLSGREQEAKFDYKSIKASTASL